MVLVGCCFVVLVECCLVGGPTNLVSPSKPSSLFLITTVFFPLVFFTLYKNNTRRPMLYFWVVITHLLRWVGPPVCPIFTLIYVWSNTSSRTRNIYFLRVWFFFLITLFKITRLRLCTFLLTPLYSSERSLSIISTSRRKVKM